MYSLYIIMPYIHILLGVLCQCHVHVHINLNTVAHKYIHQGWMPWIIHCVHSNQGDQLTHIIKVSWRHYGLASQNVLTVLGICL